jgi:hypothetical protein
MKCYGREPPKNIDYRSKFEAKLVFQKHGRTVSQTGNFMSRSVIGYAAVNRSLSVYCSRRA